VENSGTVFQRAKEAKGIGDVLGVAAHPVHHRRLKACPFCAAAFTFSYTDEHFRCWRQSCDARGDVIDLAAHVWGCSKLDAALELAGEHKGDKREWKPRPPPTPRPIDEARKRIDTIADILGGCEPARGTIVERYLESRAIDPARVGEALERLLFNPRAIYYEPNGERGALRVPAMVAQVQAHGADTGGLHCTYLASDGRGKAARDPAKKMWGPQANARGDAGGLLLIAPDPAGVLVVAEGIENALAVAQRIEGAGAFAAGSLDRLQGGMGENRWGRTDWRTPHPDEKRPAAIFKHRGRVLIVLDADMAAITINRGTRFERTVSAKHRTQIAGVLASHWWRVAGASGVRVVTPPPGMDANDLAARQEAQQA
jgi:hypothetical protein